MMQILINDIPIEIPEGPIGIKCSGGADSSLLLYILMSHVKSPVHIFSGAFKTKNRAVINTTPAVIDKCIELTGNTNIFQHIVFSEKEEQKAINDMAAAFIEKDRIKFIYSGMTSYPPDHVTETFLNKIGNVKTYNERNPNVVKSLTEYILYRPFANIDKQKIKEMYVNLGILETLFQLT